MTRDALMQELIRDERMMPYVYDDATGKLLRPGMTLIGHATVGVGRALDVHPMTQAEQLYLLGNDIDQTEAEVSEKFAWYAGLDDVRQRVVLNLVFNIGLTGFEKFHDTIRNIETGHYILAALAMEDSAWYKQVGARGVRLVRMMRTGGIE